MDKAFFLTLLAKNGRRQKELFKKEENNYAFFMLF